MANLTETPTYEAGIYRFETTDPVQGGPGGIDNLPTNQLANRTAWLKAQVEGILLDIAAIESGYATDAELAAHTGNSANPHATTKSQVGLGSVADYGIATQAEAENGTVDNKYVTPLRVTQAFKGPNSLISAYGYQKLPSGMILQWGANNAGPQNAPKTIVFPLAFPNACLCITASYNSTGPSIFAFGATPLSKTQFSLSSSWTGGEVAAFWVAIGH